MIRIPEPDPQALDCPRLAESPYQVELWPDSGEGIKVGGCDDLGLFKTNVGANL